MEEKEKTKRRRGPTKREEISDEMWNLSGLSEREEEKETKADTKKNP